MSRGRSARVRRKAIRRRTRPSRSASSPPRTETRNITYPVLRYVVFGLVVLAALVALGSWLVRTRKVSPFGFFGRTLRGATDPILKPVERRLHRMGGNPQHAGGWLIIITAVAGIVLLSLIGWVTDTFQVAHSAASRGPSATFSLITDLLYKVLFAALLVRVIAAWFGMFRYSKWIRPAYILTDWIVEPIRRVVPPVGGFDLSPVVAMFALSLLKSVIHSLLGA